MTTARASRAARSTWRCSDCGAEALRWAGKCPTCGAWSTLVESAPAAARPAGLKTALRSGPVSSAARPVGQVDLVAARHVPTGIGELDRVLGGGLVPGSVVLLAGEPGVGKSTLLLAVAAAVARSGRRALVVTGEESAAQVRLRAERVGAVADDLWLAAETDLSAVLGQVEQVEPDLLVVDSVQTVASPDVEGSAGGVTQVREVAGALTRVAKERGLTTVLVGHVTKDGTVAGPRVLEHLVDVVLQAEGDRHSALRLVRAVKNRYGAADEVGCFEQTDSGLAEVPDPSGLLRSQTGPPPAGSCLTVVLEGRRALVAEVQALVDATDAHGYPRRSVSGPDGQRVAMLLAVLGTRAGFKPLATRDVYAATVGGVRVVDPAADLALALAVVSSHVGTPVATGVVAVAEVGLSGELRRVQGLPRRLAEAARLGHTTALVAPGGGSERAPRGLRVVEVATVGDALRHAGLR